MKKIERIGIGFENLGIFTTKKMKETSFIEQNKEKWRRFERLSENKQSDPEELSELYLDISDDLSYAQTFYEKRTVRVYLNSLAQRIYSQLHIQKGETFKNLLHTWIITLPLESYRSRKSLGFALGVFLLWTLVGIVSTHFVPDFPKYILTEGYILETEANIRMGNPLKIYEDTDQLSMFIRITTNNIRVAFFAYILGVFFTIGTHIILFQNGIMLGTFQYFFAKKGLLLTSFLGIWIHGAFEISAIVLSAGAGFVLGNGWLFPQSYTRLQSMQIATKRSLKIMLSLIPFIIIAGFLESYVTHNYQRLPDWSKWMLILSSFTIVILYFVVYPIYIARKYPELVHQEPVVVQKPLKPVILPKIRTNLELLADTFRIYRQTFASWSKVVFLGIGFGSGVSWIVNYWMKPDFMQVRYYYDWIGNYRLMLGSGHKDWADFINFTVWSLVFAWIGSYIVFQIQKTYFGTSYSWRAFLKQRYFKIWMGVLLIQIPLAFLPWSLLWLYFFILPLYYLLPFATSNVQVESDVVFSTGWNFSVKSYANGMLIILFIVALTTLFMQPIAYVGSIQSLKYSEDIVYYGEPSMRDLLDLTSEFVMNVSNAINGNGMFWHNVVRWLVYTGFLFLIFPLIIIALHLQTWKEVEKETCIGLRDELEQFGKRKRNMESKLDFEA